MLNGRLYEGTGPFRESPNIVEVEKCTRYGEVDTNVARAVVFLIVGLPLANNRLPVVERV